MFCVIVNSICLGFGLMFWQNMRHKDITLSSSKRYFSCKGINVENWGSRSSFLQRIITTTERTPFEHDCEMCFKESAAKWSSTKDISGQFTGFIMHHWKRVVPCIKVRWKVESKTEWKTHSARLVKLKSGSWDRPVTLNPAGYQYPACCWFLVAVLRSGEQSWSAVWHAACEPHSVPRSSPFFWDENAAGEAGFYTMTVLWSLITLKKVLNQMRREQIHSSLSCRW